MSLRWARFVVAVAAVVGAAGWPSARTASATVGCPPSAVIEGPSGIAQPIARLLRQHGVRSEAASCAGRSVRAVVSPGTTARAYRLHIEDGFGRESDREVQSPETAASLIESWVLDEDADLVGPRAPRTLAVAKPAAPPATAAVPSRWRVMAAAEVTLTGDSTWYGGSATGCARVGPVCVGGRGRFVTSSGGIATLGDWAGGAETRNAFAALGVVALPLPFGRLSLLPAVGVGAEWVHTHAVASFADELSASADDTLLRGEAMLIASVAVARGWSLLAETGASWAPYVSRDASQGLAMFLSGPPSTGFRAGVGVGFSP
jgi:hypothetical protein